MTARLKKITKLTPEQEAELPRFRQRYLDLACNGKRIDREALQAALTDAYAVIGKPLSWSPSWPQSWSPSCWPQSWSPSCWPQSWSPSCWPLSWSQSEFFKTSSRGSSKICSSLAPTMPLGHCSPSETNANAA